MINFRCENPSCNGLLCETSICPICQGRTQVHKSEIYWNSEKNCPIFDKRGEGDYSVGSDLRPVFPLERLLLEILLQKPLAFASSSVWNVGGSNYIVDGKRMNLKFNELSKTDPKLVIAQLNKYHEENKKYEEVFQLHISNFIEENKTRYLNIKNEAINYLKEVAKGYSLDEMFVSFSGGKDSTVTSDLALCALGRGLIHIYGDTTLEYPLTGIYVKRFKENNRDIPLLQAVNKEQDFSELCEVVGPPSRVMRWCCTIFKTGPISKKIEQVFKDKKRILTFYGIRRSESKSRNKYDRASDSPKITKQRVISPIIDWLDFDIWLYILSRGIDFNDAYQQGFTRVGCWCCPNNSSWSEYLSSIYMNEEYMKMRDILYRFAKKVGKEDWKDYIDNGKWKARQGGNGLEISKNAIVSFKPCVSDANSFNFELTKPIDDFLYTLFIPFGVLDFTMGNKRLNEVYILDRHSHEPLFKLSGNHMTLKVTVIKQMKNFESLIKNQITKFQTCFGCSACQSVCKFNAIKIIPPSTYILDEKKCKGCLECVKHFDGGCYLKKVLRTKKEN